MHDKQPANRNHEPAQCGEDLPYHYKEPDTHEEGDRNSSQQNVCVYLRDWSHGEFCCGVVQDHSKSCR